MQFKKNLITFIMAMSVFSVNNAQNVSEKINANALQVQSKLIEWRRHLHQNPELSNREYKTAEYIAKHLKALGLEVTTNIAKTGVVAILKGAKPGPVIALRADMDALPVKERVNIPFKSVDTAEYLGQRVPVMHACGHDAHVSILMGTAEVLSKMKNDISGTIKFIFQPAEEGTPGNEEGGAPLMVKEGVMENPTVDAIFGLHISSQLENGTLNYKSGSFMASSDWFVIKVKGKGSHGSQPWNSIDPIAISAQIIEGLQQIVSREMELTKAPIVITVGKIHSGLRSNIIPEDCIMEGTIRTLDSGMQRIVHEKIKRTATKIAEAHGASAEVTIDTKTLVTFNQPELVSKSIASLQKAVGTENVREIGWQTGAEDFSFYGLKAPAFFFYLGAMTKGTDREKAPPHHTADFFINDDMLYVGVKAFCQLVFDYKK